MTHLVHHSLNLNGMYTGVKRNTLPFEAKKISLITAQKDLTVKNINTFSPLKTNGRKNDYESSIHWVIKSA